MIKKLSERDHIRQRPAMYIGAVNPTKSYEYLLEDNQIVYKEVQYVPGLIKIINEIIDNSVDEAIKTDFKFANQISVTITDNEVKVVDNGRGIPVKKNDEGHYLPELCWNHARAGSNFDDDENRTQIGMNGVGSFATNCFSTKFVGITDDGKNRYTITSINGAESFKEKVDKSKKRGTEVKFYPDLKLFDIDKIDETHQNIIKQRLINLSMSFPDITFKFNGKKVNTTTFKKYVSLFNENHVLYESEKYRFAILPNAEDDFRQFSYVNGLKIPDGGTHIDIISRTIVDGLREKLSRKYKNIKPGDIKNKLMIIAFLKDVPNPKFNSQSKEKITNSVREINEYYGNIEWDKIVNKVFRTPEIIDNITEVYRIKEELQKRRELKGLEKKKKIKSDKYYPATAKKKYLMVVEGESAFGGLSPVLGRNEIGYYCLKGKPLNAYSASTSKFTNNTELSELFSIIKNEGYEKIIVASDQDLDGIHIRGLILGFVEKYLPDFKNSVGVINTPVKAARKGKKLLRWTYDLNGELKLKSGEELKYFKGLGTWTKEDLRQVIEKDTLDKMIDIFEFDNLEILDDWLNDKKADKRKEYIMNNEFDIAKV